MLFTSLLLNVHAHMHTYTHAHTQKDKFMYAHVVQCAQTHSTHISKDTHIHPNLLGLFPATAEKYIMIITVWVYIPELTRSDTNTHTDTHTHTIQKCQGLLW